MRKRLIGTVVSDKMDKTRVVEIVRHVIHPIYKKRYKVSKKFYAHDEGNKTRLGDAVTIEESRPLSKLKRWKIVATRPSNSSHSTEEGEEQVGRPSIRLRRKQSLNTRGRKPRVAPPKAGQ
jgi:small subunit ribosomal protein S17